MAETPNIPPEIFQRLGMLEQNRAQHDVLWQMQERQNRKVDDQITRLADATSTLLTRMTVIASSLDGAVKWAKVIGTVLMAAITLAGVIIPLATR